MKRTSNRLERVAEQIQRKLAQIIQQEIRDPRLPGLITISGVEVSKDLSHAKVYFTALSATTIQVETTPSRNHFKYGGELFAYRFGKDIRSKNHSSTALYV